MTDDQKDRLLGDCLEDYHRKKARGEVPPLAFYREQLGDLFEDFQELVAAETLIDEALDAGQDDPLPRTWGEYTLLSVLGRGGAGVVYEALHRKLGRKVALKILRTGVDTDRTARERFRREAKHLAQLRHDHIVEIYEFGEVGGLPFYAMTLIEGPTLTGLLKSGQAPAPRELCVGLAGVADALEALHEDGIIHRDVKPGNIMIGPKGRYMLADFGLARSDLAATMTQTGDALGTPLYMSPEQMLGDRDAVERTTDIYSLGVTLYQLLTGKPPFKTDNMPALMRMVLKERPEPAKTINPDLPPGCNAIVMKCLEKDPGDRYATAAELARDLRACASGERVYGRPLTRLERGVRWTTQKKNARLLAVAATLVIALGAWFLFKPLEEGSLRMRPFPEGVRIEARIGDEGAWGLVVAEEEILLTPRVDHTIELRSDEPGFSTGSLTVNLEPGRAAARIARVEADLSHPNAIKILYGVQPPTPKSVLGTERDVTILPALEVAFPRGKVRLEDLDNWQVFVSSEFDPDDPGFIEFRVDGERVSRTEFPKLDEFALSRPIPESVRKALAAGGKASWGFVRGRKEIFTDFEVVVSDPELEARLQGIDEQLIDLGESEAEGVRPTLRALAFLRHGFDQAAFDEVQPRVLSRVESPIQVNPDANMMEIHILRLALERLHERRKTRVETTPWQGLIDARRLFEEEDWTQFNKDLAAR